MFIEKKWRWLKTESQKLEYVHHLKESVLHFVLGLHEATSTSRIEKLANFVMINCRFGRLAEGLLRNRVRAWKTFNLFTQAQLLDDPDSIKPTSA